MRRRIFLDLLTDDCSTFIRSNAVFLSTIFVGAFATQLSVSESHGKNICGNTTDARGSAFDTGSNTVWDAMNRGV